MLHNFEVVNKGYGTILIKEKHYNTTTLS